MQPELIYDAITLSETPKQTLILGAAVLLAASLWTFWLRSRGAPWHAGVKFLAAIGVLLLLLSAASRYEQVWIGKQTKLVAEGPVTGYWTKRERSRKSDGSGYHTYVWEGFTVGGVAFVYNTGVSQNYFANSGRLAIADGLRLRIAYLPEDGPVRRIVRVERLP